MLKYTVQLIISFSAIKVWLKQLEKGCSSCKYHQFSLHLCYKSSNKYRDYNEIASPHPHWTAWYTSRMDVALISLKCINAVPLLLLQNDCNVEKIKMGLSRFKLSYTTSKSTSYLKLSWCANYLHSIPAQSKTYELWQIMIDLKCCNYEG